METKIEAPRARSSLQLLPEYCLLEIYEFLDIDSSINLAETCNCLRFVADHIFKKYSKFRLDSDLVVSKGEEYIDDLFQHIGKHVTSLHFVCLDALNDLNVSIILGKISNNCKNLKNLKCRIEERTLCVRHAQPIYRFDKVEQLTLDHCHSKFTEDFTKHFFERFHRLKYVNIGGCYIGSNELKMVFQNNRRIESFVYAVNQIDFNCQLLELIPNVKGLCLIPIIRTDGQIFLELDSLLKLDRLTKLRLVCNVRNINDLLRKLSTKGIIEEMHLDLFMVDDDFLDILTSFSKLQLLVLKGRMWSKKLTSSMIWPAQLKKLRLLGPKLSQNHFTVLIQQLIQQLKSIESIDVGSCSIVNEITKFNDVMKLSLDIRHYINHSNRKQRLDIVLPYSVRSADPSKNLVLFESDRVRILYPSGKCDQLSIKIHFDGCDFL